MTVSDVHHEPILGPFAWHGQAIAADPSWQFELTDAEIGEIESNVTRLLGRGVDWREISVSDFPLPTLAPKLTRISEVLEEGCGMVRVRGLPVERLSDDEIRMAWMGLGLHVGTPVSQDVNGQLMRPICDEGSDVGTRYGQMEGGRDEVFLSSRARTASAGALRFHTDRTDVVGLLCVRQARSGGMSVLASSVAVHNEILRTRPDLLALLFRPIWRSRLGEEAGGEHLAYPLPVFGVRDGKFTSHYSRTYVEAAQLRHDIPKMSDAQWEALDVLAETAESLALQMRLEPGDVQFLNNHVIYHARTAFEDDLRPGHGRLLYRLWLCVPRNRALPEDHRVLWGDVEAGHLRGGIHPPADGNVLHQVSAPD